MPTSPSLMQLPVSSRMRALRILALLTLDLGLTLAGAGLLMSYLHKRDAASAPIASAPVVVERSAGAADAGAVLEPDVKIDKPRVVHGPRPKDGDGKKPPTTGPGKPPVLPPPPVAGPADAAPVIVPPPPVEGPADAAPVIVPPPPPGEGAPDAALPPPPIDGDPTADEQALADGVQRTVESHMPQVRQCWVNIAKQTGEKTAPEGKIEVEFAVGAGGDAERIRIVQNATGSDALGDCIVALVGGWKFPGHTGDPVVFVWPFLFRTAR